MSNPPRSLFITEAENDRLNSTYVRCLDRKSIANTDKYNQGAQYKYSRNLQIKEKYLRIIDFVCSKKWCMLYYLLRSYEFFRNMHKFIHGLFPNLVMLTF